MIEKVKNIATISIEDTDFDEENSGFIIIEIFEKLKVGLRLSTIENGIAQVWVNLSEAQDIVSALEKAIKTINDVKIQFKLNEIKEIKTINIKDTNLGKKIME